MGFSLKTSAEVGEFLESNFTRVHARNKAVLGRAGLCLALGMNVPKNFKQADSQGIELADDTIVGEELGAVVRAALNYKLGTTLDETQYRQQFKQHFEFGCLKLKELWDDCSNDQAMFVSALLKLGDFSLGDSGAMGDAATPMPIVTKPVKLKLLRTEDQWTINAAGGNGLMVISGKPGSGKSQLALDLLMQVARQGVRFLFFDLKGELEDSSSNAQQRQTRETFLSTTGASYIQLITEGLPVNPMPVGKNAPENAQIASEIASLVRAFAPQLGAKQEKSIRDAYGDLERPDFHALAAELEQRGETGVALSIIEKIDQFGLFAPADSAIALDKWLTKSHVIDFKQLGNDNDTKVLAVAFILNAIMRQLNHALPVQDGIQPLQMVLFVDEAHLLLPKEGKSGLLGSLARQGRSWGFPVWLASQDADAFLTTGPQATDFADLASCGIHFSPGTLSDSEQKNILGQVVAKPLKQGEAALRLGGKLTVGEARQMWRDGSNVEQ